MEILQISNYILRTYSYVTHFNRYSFLVLEKFEFLPDETFDNYYVPNV